MADDTPRRTTTSRTVSTPAPLGRAGESGDPAVHQLLAERQSALINQDEQAIADVDRRLADLGFGA